MKQLVLDLIMMLSWILNMIIWQGLNDIVFGICIAFTLISVYEFIREVMI